MKNPLTLSGIEPATFRFVAQQLNLCATAVPRVSVNIRILIARPHIAQNFKIICSSLFSLPYLNDIRGPSWMLL